VPPNEFVAAAQVAGLSLPLVSHIMRTSLRDFTALRRVDPTLVMAVNVTTTDLVMQGFDEMLFETLDEAGLPHGALILELSEGEAIQNAKLLHQVLTRLGERGIRLSIDDFGQGYSSMDRLRSLPLNEIKIDQAFVARMRHDPTDRAIVDSIVRLGHNLALDVVAEGVEDPVALQTLRELGCDAYQGTLFKGAVGISDAVSLVRWQQPDPSVRPIQGPGSNVAGLLRPGA
jgi:EAL domain-containing protein (putative c-di-GMP-specific phosphodiesterase class I)